MDKPKKNAQVRESALNDLLYCYAVSVVWDREHEEFINATSPGQAKMAFWRDLDDCLPELKYTEIRVRKVGRPHTSERFIENAKYRGIPNVRCGDRVFVGKAKGFVVGHNSSANLDILFDKDSEKYAGMVCNVHPASCEFASAI